MEQCLEIYDQGKLAAILHTPTNNPREPYPVLIFCSGKNGERTDAHRVAVQLSRVLANKGIGVFRFDYYGMGRSDGRYHEVTTSSKLSNIMKAYQTVAKLPGVNRNCIALLGFSDGARIALLAANRLPTITTVFWSPIFNDPVMRSKKSVRLCRHPYNSGIKVVPWAGLWIGMEYFQDLHTFNIEEELRNYSQSSLILYGGNDPILNEQQWNRDYPLFDISSRNVIKRVDGADHLFHSESAKEQLFEHSVTWLLAQCAGWEGEPDVVAKEVRH